MKTVWRLLKWGGLHGEFMFIWQDLWGFFLKYFKRKKTLYILLQWKKYDRCMERGFLKVSGLNCSLLKPRSVNIYFIWFVFKLIVEQIYLKTIFNPDFKIRDFLTGVFFFICHLWCHFLFRFIGFTLFFWKICHVWFLSQSTNSILIVFPRKIGFLITSQTIAFVCSKF